MQPTSSQCTILELQKAESYPKFERKLEGRRTSSKLPELVELVMAKPLVSAGMVAKTLEVTPQAARRIVLEPGLREMTGRGRFRAWGIV